MKRKFGVLLEKDEDGYYVASVPMLPGCHTQAKSMDDLLERIKEAIEAYLEAEKDIEILRILRCPRLSKLKPVDAETVIKALAKIGFQPVRQHGSHLVMKHPDGRITVVPVHKGEDLGRGILRKIANDAKITREELMQILEDL